MATDRDMSSGSAPRGRSGNDFLQRRGSGYESWGAEGPSGMSATGGSPDVGGRGSAAAREWGSGVAGGYGRSGSYGERGGTGRWHGANAGEAAGADQQGAASLVEQHWMRREGGSRIGMLLAGIGIGAALMYFLDPARGARRRNIFADRAVSAARGVTESMRDRAADLRNRTAGTIAETRARMRDEEVSDEQLVARVRAELGHHVERVRPIEVVAEQGAVTLRGAVAADDLPTVVAAVEKVRGVQRVVNEMTVDLQAG